MSFPQLGGYSQFLGASQDMFVGAERASSSPGEGGSESGVKPPAPPPPVPPPPSSAAAAVAPVLGVYAHPWNAQNYSAFLPYNSAELALLTHMGSQYELKDNPGAHPAGFALHSAPGFYPYGQYQYGDAARAKSATRETTSTLKAWLQEHKKNPYPTKGEKIMLAIITKMTLTQVSTWFANARRRLKKENKVTWGRSAEDRDGRIFDSDNEEDADKNEEEEEEEIDLETIDIIDKKIEEESAEDKVDEEMDGDARRLLLSSSSSSPALNGNSNSVPINKEQSVGKNPGEVSPMCQRPVTNNGNTKPKIWSLAETATSPDSNQKASAAPCAPGLKASPAPHPAFLSTNGIYTCQIGKLNNWANAAFLSANSLLGMRSLLGVNPSSAYLKHNEKKTPCVKTHSESSSDSFSPQHNEQENVQRSESPTLPLRTPFPVIHDRSHHETAQRALKTVS